MEANEEARVHRTAARQLGLITFRQCLEEGFSKKRVRARVAQGMWRRVHRGVYKTSASPLTLEERELAALLCAGEGAVLSHRTAARHWKLDTAPVRQVQLTLPAYRAIAPIEGVKLWRSR